MSKSQAGRLAIKWTEFNSVQIAELQALALQHNPDWTLVDVQKDKSVGFDFKYTIIGPQYGKDEDDVVASF